MINHLRRKLQSKFLIVNFIKMNKNQTLVLVVLLLVSTGFIVVTPLAAAEIATSEQASVLKDQLKQRVHEFRDEIKSAITNHDYNAWLTIMETIENKYGKTPKILESIDSAEKFEKYATMHDLFKDGKVEEAKALREELGLPEVRKMVRNLRHKLN
jgi:hypothetical protein